MNVQLAILHVLDSSCSEGFAYAVPEQTLFRDANALLPVPFTLTLFRDALIALETRRQVASAAHQDKGTMWKITADGTLRLRS